MPLAERVGEPPGHDRMPPVEQSAQDIGGIPNLHEDCRRIDGVSGIKRIGDPDQRRFRGVKPQAVAHHDARPGRRLLFSEIVK